MAARTPHIQDRRQEPGQRPGPQYTARAYRVADPAIASAAPGSPIPFILSTPGVKRDGLNLATLPFVLDNYRRNPVVLPFHSYLDFPIGRGEIEAIETPAGQALYALASFDIKDPFGELADRKYRDGFLFAVSIGWDDTDDRGVPVRVSKRRAVARDVLEFSVVSVPADTDALIDDGGDGAGGQRSLAGGDAGRQGQELARTRAFLAEARGVLVASDPRADALEDALMRLAACSGDDCALALEDARQQLGAGGERRVFALGSPAESRAGSPDVSPAAEPAAARKSTEDLPPESSAPADEAEAEARRRAAMAAMVAAVWVERADEADDKARKRAREALLPEYRRLGLTPPAYLDAVIVAGLPADRRRALFVNGELEESTMTVQQGAGTRVGKKYSGSTRTSLQDAHDKVESAKRVLKAMLDEAEDSSGERGARGCGCGGGQSSHQPAAAAESGEAGVPLDDALRALSLLYPDAEIRATVRKDGQRQAPAAARQVSMVQIQEVSEEEGDHSWGGGQVVLPEKIHAYLKLKAIKKLEAGPDGSETSVWFSRSPQDEDWPITPQTLLGVDVLGSIPENIQSLIKALGTGVDPAILDIDGVLATDPDWDGGSGSGDEPAADDGAADEAPAEEPAAEGDAENGTQSIDDLLARFAAVTAAA